MSEHGPMSPEKLAEIYQVEPYQQKFDLVKKHYQDDYCIKWILNRENYNIKIWSYNALNAVDHIMVDKEAWQDGNFGNIYKSRGMNFGYKSSLNELEKAAVEIAIKKFLSE